MRRLSRVPLNGKQGVCIYKRSKRTSSVAAGNPFLLVGKHPKPFEQTVPLVWLRGNPAAFRLPPSVDFPLPAPPQTPQRAAYSQFHTIRGNQSVHCGRSSERKTSHSAEQMFCTRISIFILGFRGSYPQSMAANSPSSLLLWITFLDFLLSPCQAPPPLL